MTANVAKASRRAQALVAVGQASRLSQLTFSNGLDSLEASPTFAQAQIVSPAITHSV
jgi:hypothetical protein